MATINAGNIQKGDYLIFKGKPYMVTKADFMSPGKGAAVMRTKLKSIESGAVQEFTYKTNEQVEVADVEKKETTLKLPFHLASIQANFSLCKALSLL